MTNFIKILRNLEYFLQVKFINGFDEQSYFLEKYE